ncbi:hypothetical protein GCM10027564_18240 [Luteimonas notoginsengisoli]
MHLVASTAYLARRGVPRHARELAAHDAIVASPLLRWALRDPAGGDECVPRPRPGSGCCCARHR